MDYSRLVTILILYNILNISLELSAEVIHENMFPAIYESTKIPSLEYILANTNMFAALELQRESIVTPEFLGEKVFSQVPAPNLSLKEKMGDNLTLEIPRSQNFAPSEEENPIITNSPTNLPMEDDISQSSSLYISVVPMDEKITVKNNDSPMNSSLKIPLENTYMDIDFVTDIERQPSFIDDYEDYNIDMEILGSTINDYDEYHDSSTARENSDIALYEYEDYPISTHVQSNQNYEQGNQTFDYADYYNFSMYNRNLQTDDYDYDNYMLNTDVHPGYKNVQISRMYHDTYKRRCYPTIKYVTKQKIKKKKIPVYHTVYKTKISPKTYYKTVYNHQYKTKYLTRYVPKYSTQVVYNTKTHYISKYTTGYITDYKTNYYTETEYSHEYVTDTVYSTKYAEKVQYTTEFTTKYVPKYVTRYTTTYKTEYANKYLSEYVTVTSTNEIYTTYCSQPEEVPYNYQAPRIIYDTEPLQTVHQYQPDKYHLPQYPPLTTHTHPVENAHHHHAFKPSQPVHQDKIIINIHQHNQPDETIIPSENPHQHQTFQPVYKDEATKIIHKPDDITHELVDEHQPHHGDFPPVLQDKPIKGIHHHHQPHETTNEHVPQEKPIESLHQSDITAHDLVDTTDKDPHEESSYLSYT